MQNIMTTPTHAQAAAKEIFKRYYVFPNPINNRSESGQDTIQALAEIITSHMGDGRDKDRMDLLQIQYTDDLKRNPDTHIGIVSVVVDANYEDVRVALDKQLTHKKEGK